MKVTPGRKWTQRSIANSTFNDSRDSNAMLKLHDKTSNYEHKLPSLPSMGLKAGVRDNNNTNLNYEANN